MVSGVVAARLLQWLVLADLQRATVFRVATAMIFAARHMTIGHTICQYRSCFWKRNIVSAG